MPGTMGFGRQIGDILYKDLLLATVKEETFNGSRPGQNAQRKSFLELTLLIRIFYPHSEQLCWSDRIPAVHLGVMALENTPQVKLHLPV